MTVVTQSVEGMSRSLVLQALGLSRASFYRMNSASTPDVGTAQHSCRVSGRALSIPEKENVRSILYGDRFVDQTPTQIYATLLDEGAFHCSARTMYRILKKDGPCQTRTQLRTHTAYARPEHLATRPNELWSWDITRLKGPVKYSYFQLYVILDVFSRYVVGWMIAEREHQDLAAQLIDDTITNQRIEPNTLTIHADRGASMTSKSVALLLSDMGVMKSHSRPHTSNDNPYSEAQFKTLKYRPEFPDRFGSIEDARAFCSKFFRWYNHEHHHSGIALLTPAAVHYGKSDAIIAKRQETLDAAYRAHPERFVKSRPKHPAIPEAVWINAPEKKPVVEKDQN
ncbi:MAG: IS3 family transposase [Chthonomonadales bacterium]